MEYDYDMPSKDARMWAMLCHLGGLSPLLGIPFGNIIVPFVIWLMKRESDPFIDYHGKEAINFQISMTIYGVVSALLVLALVGLILLPILLVAGIVLTIIAAIKANDGHAYRYPFVIRLVD